MMASWPPLGRIFLILSSIMIYICARSALINSYFKLLGLFFVIPHISWQISKIVRHYFAQITFISPVNKAVLITGCDSGFGQLAAKALDTYGFHVFAGCLQPKGLGAQRLYKTTSNRLRILNLDVTQPSDIEAAIKEIEESDLQLWAVINNAAITDWGPVEWDSDSYRIRKIFEVNLFGLIKITNSCLPLLRKTKGRIVNISSVFGRITVGGMVPYCMSKHAVRSYTDGLRREISHTGIKVICIEPLAYQTEMTKEDRIPESLKSAWQMADDGTKEFYGKASQQELINDLKGLLKIASPNVFEVTEAIEEATTATSPSDFYRCYSLFHGLVIWLSEQMNEQFLDILLRRPFLRRIVHILALPALKGKV